ncbi:N-acetyltransferase family protein [Acidithiobacillus sp. IBUN Pt1247-S3]|uniref:GNAT family N-acetyltransferase n=1 Tax=Acidithiobacillus sp. IBUN Pt1247-S3 TaxID=3166642 RepID=UPI0034E54A6C
MPTRIATSQDAEAIGEIRIAAWKAAYTGCMPASYLATLSSTDNLDQRREFLANTPNGVKVHVAEKSDIVVGFSIVGQPRYPTNPNAIELWALNVLPEFWRTGVGSELIQVSIKSVLKGPYSSMELWCIKGNMAAELAYQRNGFSSTHKERTTSNLTGHPLHEVLYSKML